MNQVAPSIAAEPNPEAPFIIWTLQRTGGTNLAQALFKCSAAGSGKHEPFNVERVYGSVNQDWKRDGDLPALQASLAEICSHRVQMKHCVEMGSAELNLALAEAATAAGYQHLFLYRRQSSSRLLSLHFARETGVWGKRDATRAAGSATVLAPLPVVELVAHQRRCDNLLKAVYQRLLALGARPASVAFEDVYMNPRPEGARAQLSKVLDHLGIKPADRVAFIDATITSGDQGTRMSYEQFSGRDELAQRVQELPGFLPEALGATHEMHLVRHPVQIFKHLKVDSMPLQIVDGKPFALGGVALSGPSVRDKPSRLVVEHGEGRTVCDQDLPSPAVALHFKDDSAAARARFRAPGLVMRRREPVRLLLVTEGEPDTLLAEIRFVRGK